MKRLHIHSLIILAALLHSAANAAGEAIEIEFPATAPRAALPWQGMGVQIYPWLANGADYKGRTPVEMYDALTSEMGVRYARVMIRIDQQKFADGQWDWPGAPSNLDDNMWRSLGVMQARGIEPIVTPIFWPAGVICKTTFPVRDNVFLATPEANQAVVDWFSGMCTEAPKYGFTPRLASIQNEPDNDDHLKIAPDDLHELTKLVVARLDAEGHALQFVVADTATTRQTRTYAPAQLPAFPSERIAAISFHTYGGDLRKQMAHQLGGLGYPLWMTEQAFNEEPEPHDSWEFAAKVADGFYRDIAIAGATSWYHWSIGPRSQAMTDDAGRWFPYAAAVGMAGRQLPLGARFTCSAEKGHIRALRWQHRDRQYVWVFNGGSRDAVLRFDGKTPELLEIRRVTEGESFVPVDVANGLKTPGRSAMMFTLSL